jgi:hypothetical protein
MDPILVKELIDDFWSFRNKMACFLCSIKAVQVNRSFSKRKAAERRLAGGSKQHTESGLRQGLGQLWGYSIGKDMGNNYGLSFHVSVYVLLIVH